MAAMPMMASIPEDSSFRYMMMIHIFDYGDGWLLPRTKVAPFFFRDWVGEEEQVAHRCIFIIFFFKNINLINDESSSFSHCPNQIASVPGQWLPANHGLSTSLEDRFLPSWRSGVTIRVTQFLANHQQPKQHQTTATDWWLEEQNTDALAPAFDKTALLVSFHNSQDRQS